MSMDLVQSQALLLAKENRESDPDIQRVLWFPAENEVRLIETTELIPTSDTEVSAFYFLASPQDDLPLPSRVALIRPNEVGRLRLPHGWGEWSSAREL